MTPKHMPLAEWDKKVAPILGAIPNRARWIRLDAAQIQDWIRQLPVAPEFETEALAAMQETKEILTQALQSINLAIELYNQKEKVT